MDKISRERMAHAKEAIDHSANDLLEDLHLFVKGYTINGDEPTEADKFSSRQKDMMNIIKGYTIKQYMGEMVTMTMAGHSLDAMSQLPDLEDILKMEL